MIEPVLDSAHAVSGTITPEDGGSISATGSDGSSFTLDIPPGAVIEGLDVTMTPIASLGDPPFSGPVAGVDLRPHGLMLIEPAILTIEPSRPIPVADRMGFAYARTGDDFHYAPLNPGTGAISMSLASFSGHGAGRASDTDRARQGTTPPGGVEAQAQAELSELVRQSAASGRSILDMADQFEAVFRRWDGGLIGPRTFAAETDDRIIFEVMREWLTWIKAMQTLFPVSMDGSDDAMLARARAERWQSLARGFHNAYRRAYRRCTEDHELEAAYALVRIERAVQTLGLPVETSAVGDSSLCLTFELDVAIQLEVASYESGGILAREDVRMSRDRIRVTMEDGHAGWGRWSGSHTPRADHWRSGFHGEDRWCGPFTGPITWTTGIEVVNMGLDLNYSDESPTPRSERVWMWFYPGEMKMTTTSSGQGCYPGEESTHWFEDAVFRPAHEDERLSHEWNGHAVYRIDNWSYIGGATVARKRYDRRLTRGDIGGVGAVIVEDTTLTLRHTPAPAPSG